jgi:hypothetical protein
LAAFGAWRRTLTEAEGAGASVALSSEIILRLAPAESEPLEDRLNRRQCSQADAGPSGYTQAPITETVTDCSPAGHPARAAEARNACWPPYSNLLNSLSSDNLIKTAVVQLRQSDVRSWTQAELDGVACHGALVRPLACKTVTRAQIDRLGKLRSRLPVGPRCCNLQCRRGQRGRGWATKPPRRVIAVGIVPPSGCAAEVHFVSRRGEEEPFQRSRRDRHRQRLHRHGAHRGLAASRRERARRAGQQP